MTNGKINGSYKLIGVILFALLWSATTIWWASGTDKTVKTMERDIEKFINEDELEGMFKLRDIEIDYLKKGQTRIIDKLDDVLDKLP